MCTPFDKQRVDGYICASAMPTIVQVKDAQEHSPWRQKNT